MKKYNIQKILNHYSPESHSNNNLNKIKLKKQKFEMKSNANIVINKSYLFDNFYIPKVQCFSSFIPFPCEFQYLLKKIREYSLGEMGKISIRVEKITYIGGNDMDGNYIVFCNDPINCLWYKFEDDIVLQVKNFKNEIIDYGMPYVLFF